MILLNELDLEKSFKKLKDSLIESESIVNSGSPHYFMQAYISLAKSVEKHISDCAGLEPIHFMEYNKDDLKDINT